MSEKVQFRPGALAAELQKRGKSEGSVAKRDLERYYEIIRESQPSNFTVGEMLALISSLMALTMTPPDVSAIRKYLWAEVLDGAEKSEVDDWGDGSNVDLGEKYGVDMDKLAKRVKKLSPVESFALLDLAEQVWWDWVKEHPEEPEADALERHWRWYTRSCSLAG